MMYGLRQIHCRNTGQRTCRASRPWSAAARGTASSLRSAAAAGSPAAHTSDALLRRLWQPAGIALSMLMVCEHDILAHEHISTRGAATGPSAGTDTLSATAWCNMPRKPSSFTQVHEDANIVSDLYLGALLAVRRQPVRHQLVQVELLGRLRLAALPVCERHPRVVWFWSSRHEASSTSTLL